MGDPEAIDPTDENELVFALVHEVGNLLAASRLHADLLIGIDDASEVERTAATISQLTSRMGSLISLIRPILTPPSGPAAPIDPLDVFEGLQRSLDDNCHERVRFNLRSAADLPYARIDEHALHHVLLIGIYAALEDSAPSGVVTVSAASKPAGRDELTFVVESSGPDRQAGGALRGQLLAQRVAEAVMKARGGRTQNLHRDGFNREEFTVPAAKD